MRHNVVHILRRETRLLSYDTTHVQKTYVLASCVLCTSRNQMASIRHTVHVHTTVVHIVRRETRLLSYDTTHVQKTYVLASCVLCTSRNQMASIRHTVHVHTTLRLGVVHRL